MSNLVWQRYCNICLIIICNFCNKIQIRNKHHSYINTIKNNKIQILRRRQRKKTKEKGICSPSPAPGLIAKPCPSFKAGCFFARPTIKNMPKLKSYPGNMPRFHPSSVLLSLCHLSGCLQMPAFPRTSLQMCPFPVAWNIWINVFQTLNGLMDSHFCV